MACELELSSEVYDSGVVSKTSYSLLGVATVTVSRIESGVMYVELCSLVDDSDEELRALFLQTLSDYQMRAIIELETGALRQLIYAQAFSKTDILLPESSFQDGWSDPCSIAPRDGNSTGNSFSV
jgi:His-Xaa-Ser system protein HxsD